MALRLFYSRFFPQLFTFIVICFLIWNFVFFYSWFHFYLLHCDLLLDLNSSVLLLAICFPLSKFAFRFGVVHTFVFFFLQFVFHSCSSLFHFLLILRDLDAKKIYCELSSPNSWFLLALAKQLTAMACLSFLVLLEGKPYSLKGDNIEYVFIMLIVSFLLIWVLCLP